MSFKKTNRTIHRWASIIVLLPLLMTIVTGGLLLVKKEFSILQPTTMRGSEQYPSIPFNRVLTIAQSVEQAKIASWHDINRLDVRPSKGIIKIRSEHDSIEIQIDAVTGKVLHVAKRNSDLIESIHDGTFFEKSANLWLMLPVVVISIAISITGFILFLQPYFTRRKRNKN